MASQFSDGATQAITLHKVLELLTRKFNITDNIVCYSAEPENISILEKSCSNVQCFQHFQADH